MPFSVIFPFAWYEKYILSEFIVMNAVILLLGNMMPCICYLVENLLTHFQRMNAQMRNARALVPQKRIKTTVAEKLNFLRLIQGRKIENLRTTC